MMGTPRASVYPLPFPSEVIQFRLPPDPSMAAQPSLPGRYSVATTGEVSVCRAKAAIPDGLAEVTKAPCCRPVDETDAGLAPVVVVVVPEAPVVVVVAGAWVVVVVPEAPVVVVVAG